MNRKQSDRLNHTDEKLLIIDHTIAAVIGSRWAGEKKPKIKCRVCVLMESGSLLSVDLNICRLFSRKNRTPDIISRCY